MIALTNAIGQNTLKQESTNQYIKTSSNAFDTNFDLLDLFNETEIEDLETLITAEFAQGSPSDTELQGF